MDRTVRRRQADRASRELADNLRLVDVVVELRDARIPRTSAGRGIEESVCRKPRVVVLNKADLAAPDATARWLAWFREQEVPAVAVSVTQDRGMQAMAAEVRSLAARKLARLRQSGLRGRRVRAMVVGIPNVGKSSLINRCAGGARTRTGDFPGITRGRQWVMAAGGFDLLDMPGVVPARIDCPADLFKLAATGALRPGAYDPAEVAMELLRWMVEEAPDRLGALEARAAPQSDLPGILAEFGRARGFLGPGGAVDLGRTGAAFVREFQRGAFGRATLELPGPGAVRG